MIFVKNLQVLLSVIVFEKDLDMMFNNVQNGETRLSRLQKMSFQHSGKMCIFPKGLTHDFPQKFEISSDLDMMMNNVLKRKNGFLDYKNVILK